MSRKAPFFCTQFQARHNFFDKARLLSTGLSSISCLIAGAATEGEKVAAEQAKDRILQRLKQWKKEDPPIEYRFYQVLHQDHSEAEVVKKSEQSAFAEIDSVVAADSSQVPANAKTDRSAEQGTHHKSKGNSKNKRKKRK